MERYDDNTALMLAAKKGYTDIVRALVCASPGASLDNTSKRESFTALMHAAKDGHTEIVRVLVKAGSALNTRVSAGDYLGLTALGLAMRGNNDETAAFLLNAGAHE